MVIIKKKHTLFHLILEGISLKMLQEGIETVFLIDLMHGTYEESSLYFQLIYATW